MQVGSRCTVINSIKTQLSASVNAPHMSTCENVSLPISLNILRLSSSQCVLKSELGLAGGEGHIECGSLLPYWSFAIGNRFVERDERC